MFTTPPSNGFSSSRKRQLPIDNSCVLSKRTKLVPPRSFENNQLTQTDSKISTSSREDDLIRQITELRRSKSDLEEKYHSTVETVNRCLSMTRSLLIEKCQLEKRHAREKAMENRFRLGQFVTQRQGMTFVEQWIDGFEFSAKQRMKEQLRRTKDNLHQERKNFAKKKGFRFLSSSFSDTSNDGISCSGSNSSSSSSIGSENCSSLMSYQDWCEYDEVLRLRQLTIKREEFDLLQDLEKLTRERNVHIRELKRLFHEDHSRFNQHVLLHHRYLLLSLIGKGGFSEVHQAFDLREQRNVACKIHQLNKEWKEEKKANFLRHALREYQIHQRLKHKRKSR